MGDYNQLDLKESTVGLRAFCVFLLASPSILPSFSSPSPGSFFCFLKSQADPFLLSVWGGGWKKNVDWLKHDDWVIQQRDVIKKIWSDAGRPYAVGHGVEWEVSAQDGKEMPEAARRERESQVAKGWDV